ncbi:DUF2283 domain-containing protein [candidate division KSB1 bacterium]|nr:DUF2283 domain-containing protein [candidate division KSB1 bacterium]MBL7093634.1 DUF2283 domain-containing protein [candidate division KSB1 bacterium]
MRVFYDNEVDALYLEISKEKPEGVTEISDGINLDVTESKKLVGIEILDASKKFDIQTFLSYNLELNKNILLRKTA